MAINRYKPHLTVFLEDSPYREIFNGIKQLNSINENILEIKNPCGGWSKVFSTFEENLRLINQNQNQYVLLIMDFDFSFTQRKNQFDNIIAEETCKDRVFLLGIDNKESEDLKRFLQLTDNEKVGKQLIESCFNQNCNDWKNSHLEINFPEISRFQSSPIFNSFLTH